MTAASVRGFGEHGADPTDAHGLPIKDPCEVVLRRAGEHVSALDQRVSRLVTGRPGRLHLGGVESAVRLAIQTIVPGGASRLENAVENDALGGNDSRHWMNRAAGPDEPGAFLLGGSGAIRHTR